MSIQTDNVYPWVIVRLRNEQYGVSSAFVREMVLINAVTTLPNTAEYVRGVLNLRGRIIPLIDLRVLLGMTSSEVEAQELVETLNLREQDHVSWLNELQACVNEERTFTLATDPHQCAFGKWYDRFTTDNLVLSGVLRRFDEPHKRIHGIAKKVESCMESGDTTGAHELIDSTRDGELAEMVQLFEAARELLKKDRRETAVILEYKDVVFAAAADGILSVERLSDQFDAPPDSDRGNGVSGVEAVGRRTKDDTLVLLLNPVTLLEVLSRVAA